MLYPLQILLWFQQQQIISFFEPTVTPLCKLFIFLEYHFHLENQY